MRPVAEAFERLWPEATLMNLLDDRLSADLAETGALDAALTRRFVDLAQYAERAGAQSILFTCSAFGPAIEQAARAVGVPTYKPNEAMFREALALASATPSARVGLLSTFEPSVQSMSAELFDLAASLALNVQLETRCAAGALTALGTGDATTHDRLVVEQATHLERCDVVMLGQFSMARTQPLVAAQIDRPVLTSPDSAVRLLKKTLLAA